MNENLIIKISNSQYKSMANAVRMLTIEAIHRAKSGHPGLPMGMADFCTVLFANFLKFNPFDPKWHDRDRFILSAGHGSMLLYSLLYLTGYQDINLNDIKNFRQLNAKTAGHPEYGLLAGIEATTGPLGQGIANAVGMAIAEKNVSARFGTNQVNHKIYTLCGDGCLMEGIAQEAMSLAGHLRLNNLIVIFDDNAISIDGPTNKTISDDYLARFNSANWQVMAVDGHDYSAINKILYKAQQSTKPVFIKVKTKIGFGSPADIEGTSKAHSINFSDNEIETIKHNLNWQANKFEIPSTILKNWRDVYKRNMNKYKQSLEQISDEFKTFLSKKIDPHFYEQFSELQKSNQDIHYQATRKSSAQAIDFINNNLPYLIGGSADLSTSNCTQISTMKIFTHDNFAGNYIHYGTREHAMMAIMNGLSLYGGFIPYGGTFLSFSDYLKPALRMAALMQLQTILVVTHDSIGVGEDGPTHQPVEHLSSLRAIPNLLTFRPADLRETLECWEIALKYIDRPSVICLTRQKVKAIDNNRYQDKLCQKGAYPIFDNSQSPDVTIYATGSEVAIAIDAAKFLIKHHQINIRVISVPCWELFDHQDKQYQDYILKNNSIKVAVEAASNFGWAKFIGQNGIFIGVNNFGLSAPYHDLYEYFGITVENICDKIKQELNKQGKL